jgi:pimeloyl-ACP methyl ester carboxylesterase
MSTSDITPTVVLVHGARSCWPATPTPAPSSARRAATRATSLGSCTSPLSPPRRARPSGAINARYPDVPLSAALRTFTYTDDRGEQATDTFVDATLFHDAVCAEAPADVADTLARTQRPASLACFGTSVTGTPAWKTLPSWAVVATADHAIHPNAERDMAKRAGSEITEIDASHAVPATHPGDVAAVIVRAVKALT